MHCENCGRENPVTDDGYTTCCNELTCSGPRPAGLYNTAWEGRVWGNNEIASVVACCGAKADEKFEARDGKMPATFWLLD